MKVALCFSGQIRTLEKCVDTINETIIDKLPSKPDIFCHFSPCSAFDEIIVEKLLSPKLYHFEPDEDVKIVDTDLFNECYNKRHEGGRPYSWGPRTKEGVEQILRQMYSVYMSNEIKKQIEEKEKIKYDIVFRIRPDQRYYGVLEDLSLVKEGVLHVPNHDWHHGINDRFSFAKSDTMDKYASMYLNIVNLLKEKDAFFHPETIAMKNCKLNNISISSTNIVCMRVRQKIDVVPLNDYFVDSPNKESILKITEQEVLNGKINNRR